ncbi:MAG: heme lyase CcmF/NrfE family subunit [Pelagibacteraceae bacterium]
MLSNIGNSLIFLNLIITLVIIYFSFESLNIKKNIIHNKLYNLTLYQTTISIISFFTLVLAFIVSDFSVITVFQNSHSLKPLFYKITGSWGNHEGSLLLWVNVLVIFSYLFLVFNNKIDKNFRLYTLIFQNILILGFSLFLFFNSNPFSSVIPIPREGLGLNPILQDPALAIHPPLLYIGFVGSSIYFSAAMASLISNFSGKIFAKTIKPWVLISWVFQTLGIIVGSIWAYYELGWGGFWFWDPVENASLFPWFAMTALLHSLIVLKKRNTLYGWVIILCLSTFTLSVTGTFLVRSGILNSVHTFANDPDRGLYILIFLSAMIFSSLIIFLKKYKRESYIFESNSKEAFILINNWFMAFFLFTVIIGTTYPIFVEVLNNTKISVGPPFYNIVIIPLLIPFIFIMAMAPKVSWIKHKYNFSLKFLIVFFLASTLSIIISVSFPNYSLISNLVIASSLFLIIYSLIDFYKNFKNKIKIDYSRIVSHLGFGLLIFFISINHNFSIENDFNIKVGEKKVFDNYNIKFNSLNLDKRENYKAVIGLFEITNLKNLQIQNLKPEIRIYKNPETLTYESSIRSKINYDLYLTMSNLDRSDFYNVKFQKKPFMLWIWLSALLISIGGILRIFKNEN